MPMPNSSGKRTASSTGKKKAVSGRWRVVKSTTTRRNPRNTITQTSAATRPLKVAGTTAEWDRFEERIVQELRRGLHVQLRRAAVGNVDLASLGDPEEIAAAMVAVLPASHPFDEVIGPFYDTPGLTQWLQITRQALHQRLKAASVLGCPLDDGSVVYPAWQFLDNGATLPGLAEVLKSLSSGTGDAWQIALWLSAPSEDLDGASVRDWLRANRSREPVLALARQSAAAWSR